MKQEITVNRIIFTLKLEEKFDQVKGHLIKRFDDEAINILRTAFMQVWVAGWEESNKEFALKLGSRRSVPVYRISLDGKEKVKFDNFTKAAKSVNGQRKFISRATKTGEIKYGYCWVLFNAYHKGVKRKGSRKK